MVAEYKGRGRKPETGPLTVSELIALKRLGGVRVSPGGQWVVCEITRLETEGGAYTTDLWRIPLDGSAPIQLTWGAARDHSPQFRGDGALLFLSNRPTRHNGEESGRQQVWMLPAHGGEPRPLTDEPLGVGHFIVRGARMALLCAHQPGVKESEQRQVAQSRKLGASGLRYTEMPVRLWDHWLGPQVMRVVVMDAEGQDRQIVQGQWDIHSLSDAEFDLDGAGRHLIVTVNRRAGDGIRDRDLLLVDLATGGRRILGHGERVDHEGVAFSPDGAWVASVRHVREDGACGCPEVWLYPTSGAPGRPLVTGWDYWPQIARWTPDGEGLLVTAATRGRDVPFLLPMSGDPIALGGPRGSYGPVDCVSRPEGLAFVSTFSSVTQPPELCVAPLSGGDHTLLTALSGFSSEAGEALVDVERIEISGADDVPVEALVISPKAGQGPRGALIWVHGGPIAHHFDGWHWRWNALVAASQTGCTVVLPNPRGSTGYGQDFIEGVWDNAWGGACYGDVMAITEAIAARPEIDGERMALMGGSFGGYMANWIGAQSDRFKCLVSHASIYNLPAFAGSTDEPGWFAEQMGGPDEANPELDRYSPHRLVKGWRTPTLITHGEQDYRVPVTEALMLFGALQRLKVPSELILFPDEGHWISRPPNVKQWYDAWIEFVRRHLDPR